MAGTEGCILTLISKEWLHSFQFKRHRDPFPKTVDIFVNRPCLGILRFQRSPDCRKQMGIIRVHRCLFCQLQRADKRLLQLREKMQRPAEESYTAADRLSAGKAGNGLVDDCLKNRRSQICFGSPFVDQRLDVTLGKHTAPGGNRINLFVMGRFCIQPGGIRLQEGCHLVDEGSCPAGTDPVHPFFQPSGEVNDLCVLPAELNCNISLRCCLLQSGCNRHNFLHEADAKAFPEIDGA